MMSLIKFLINFLNYKINLTNNKPLNMKIRTNKIKMMVYNATQYLSIIFLKYFLKIMNVKNSSISKIKIKLIKKIPKIIAPKFK
jgi:hypothetical protein